MRALVAASILFASAPAAADRGLTQVQIEHYVGTYLPAVRACYADNVHDPRAPGRLLLEAKVLAGGTVIGLTVQAPGVTGTDLAMLTHCISKQVEEWHFPMRRDDTMISIPYYFQKTATPTAGPFYGCWNPKGCKKQ